MSRVKRVSTLRWRLLVLGGIAVVLVLLAGVWFLVLKPATTYRGAAASVQPGFIRSIFGVDQPMGVALSPDGARVYAAERGGDRYVRVFDAKDGRQVQALAPPDTAAAARRPTYVAVNPLGFVFVNDLAQKGISVYSPKGEFQGWLNPMATSGGWNPLALAFDKEGNFYVTDITEGKHRVLVFDGQNQLKTQFGGEGNGPGEFSFPNGIATADNGDIWVADSNNARIQVFDPSGILLATYREAGGQGLSLPRGIGFNKLGEVVVVDTMDGSLAAFDPTNTQTSYRVGRFGTGNGEMRYPQGLAIDAAGRIFVADRDNNRIQVFAQGKP